MQEYLIVGSGLFGSVFAHEAAKRGHKVKEAAISKFVEDRNVGITVSDLNEIPDIMEKMSDHQYETILKNVKKVGNEMRRGKYILSAISKAEKCLLG